MNVVRPPSRACALAGAMDGVDVGATVKQERNAPPCRTLHRPMQRRASATVTTIQECRIAVEKIADTLDIVGLRGQMYGMILGWRNSCPASASLIEKLRDGLMTPVPGHFDETAVVIAVPLRVCACFEQYPHRLEMPFSYGEVDSRRVEILGMAQAGIAVDQAPNRGCVAGCGGRDRVPDITAVGFKFRRLDHAPVHIGFEPWPALESIRPGEHKLRIVQGEFPGDGARVARGGFRHGVWFASEDCIQQLFRPAFELIEIRVLGERAGRKGLLHNELLSWLSVYGSVCFARCPLSRAEKSSSNQLLNLRTFQGDSVLPADTMAS